MPEGPTTIARDGSSGKGICWPGLTGLWYLVLRWWVLKAGLLFSWVYFGDFGGRLGMGIGGFGVEAGVGLGGGGGVVGRFEKRFGFGSVANIAILCFLSFLFLSVLVCDYV